MSSQVYVLRLTNIAIGEGGQGSSLHAGKVSFNTNSCVSTSFVYDCSSCWLRSMDRFAKYLTRKEIYNAILPLYGVVS